MFRKRKRPVKKAGLRRKQQDDDDDDDDDTGIDRDELHHGRSITKNKRIMKSKDDNDNDNDNTSNKDKGDKKMKKKVMHEYKAGTKSGPSASELATSSVQHHPLQNSSKDDNYNNNNNSSSSNNNNKTTEEEKEQIKKEKQPRNKLLAGPIKISTNIRTTCRFDYQPDICKDYKDTGFCGFGDTCIYLHDRGDTMTGWQLEQQWEKQQKEKQLQQEQQIQDFLDNNNSNKISSNSSNTNTTTTTADITTEDGIPFACYICRNAFSNPIVTNCGHYFCEKCIMNHVQQQDQSNNNNNNNNSSNCPICSKDTFRVFNEPLKLITKKRRITGSTKSSWEDFYKLFVDKNK